MRKKLALAMTLIAMAGVLWVGIAKREQSESITTGALDSQSKGKARSGRDDFKAFASDDAGVESTGSVSHEHDSSLGGRPKLTDERAREVLARFNEQMAQVSREDYQEGEQRVAKFLEKARKLEKEKPVPPKESLYVDQNGQQWTKLEYPSGEERYEFPK